MKKYYVVLSIIILNYIVGLYIALNIEMTPKIIILITLFYGIPQLALLIYLIFHVTKRKIETLNKTVWIALFVLFPIIPVDLVYWIKYGRL